MQAATVHGIPYADLLALVRFTAPYAGYPAAADALARLGEIAGELGIDTRADDPGRADPRGAEHFRSDDAWMAQFVADRTARAWSEERLSRRERAVVALTTDVGQQTLGESFHLHVRQALDAGLSPEEIRDAVRFCGEMGVAKAVEAVRELGAVHMTSP